MYNRLKIPIVTALSSVFSIVPVVAAELGLSAGSFHFPATDYYYPNFYDEAGIRGEITFQKEGWRGFFGRLQSYGYPMDDNIFENVIELGLTQRYEDDRGAVYVRPIIGYGLVRLQYPAPYYPAVDKHYLSFARLGYDVGYSVKFGRFSVGANNRGRWLVNVGSNYSDRNTVLWAMEGEFGIRLNPKWRTSVRAGCEFDGYYEKVFLKDNLRPYIEVGVFYAL
jgi:hypothetical protein